MKGNLRPWKRPVLRRLAGFGRFRKRERFELVDFGSSNAYGMRVRASQNMKKVFVAVDPEYRLRETHNLGHLRSTSNFKPVPLGMKAFVEFMVKNGSKSREIQFRMPTPRDVESIIPEFRFLFKNFERVVEKGGKIFVTSEVVEIIHVIESLAQKNHLHVKPAQPEQMTETELMAMHGMKLAGMEPKIHGVEITIA